MAKFRASKSEDTIRRSEVVTVRLDPKLKYLAELAARRQRRTLSSFIEWAIEHSLTRLHPAYAAQADDAPTFMDAAPVLWDVDEADRLAKLALNYPELLNHEEQLIWKLICENGFLWKGRYDKPGGEWQWNVVANNLLIDRLRQHWDTFRDVARGKQPASALPTGEKDDEIPF